MTRPRANSMVCGLLLLCLVLGASESAQAFNQGSGVSIDATIPALLDVPRGNEVQQVLFAEGVQIYEYNGTAWNLKNVSADLYNFKGVKVGHHFFLGEKDIHGGQSSWETFHPYTRFTGRTVASVQVEDDSINWLLVQLTTNIGKTFFGATTFLQRLYTQHGLAPSATFPAKEGDLFDSKYTSLYKFSKRTHS